MLVHVVPYGALKAHLPRGLKRKISFEAENINEVISALSRIEGVEAMLHLYHYDWRIGRTWKQARRFTSAETLVANKLSGNLNDDGSISIHLRPDITASDPGTIITSLIISAITTAASMIISYLNPPDTPRNDTRKSVLYDNSGNTHTEGSALPYLMGLYCYIEPPVIELSTSTMAGTGQNDGSGTEFKGGTIWDYMKYVAAGNANAAGGSKSPRRLENNAFSNSIQRVLFAVGAGKIGGIRGDNQFEKESNIWVNEERLRDPETGNYSIPAGSFSWEDNLGEEGQAAIGLSPGIANALGRNRQLKNKTVTGSSDTHQERVTDELVDRVVIRVRANGLVKRDKKGNESNTSVSIRVRCKRLSDSVWLDRGSMVISGKTSAAVDREYNISAPPKNESGETWHYELWRTTADSENDLLINDTVFVGFDEYQDREFKYDGTESPDSWPTACLGTVFKLADLDQSRAPKVGVLARGIEAWVATNYDPETGTYATSGPGTINGRWDGTLTKKPTQNGAWHWLTMMITPRLGLGLPLSFFDRYSIYDAAVFNDQMVNGRKRFTVNGAIRDFGKKWEVAADLARSFRAMQFWAGDRVLLVQDRPTGFDNHTVTNALAKDGVFNINKKKLSERKNVIEVVWYNPADMWRQAVTVYRDEDHIAMMRRHGLGDNGELVQRVTKFLCTNEQEAYDYARMVAYDSCYLGDGRSWETNLVGTTYLPGHIIELDDQNTTGKAPGERIRNIIDANTIQLDHPVTLKKDRSYKLRGILNNMRAVRDIVPVTADTTTDILTVPSHGLVRFTPFSIVEEGGVQPRMYRIVGVEDASTPGFYTVTASQHSEAKYAWIEQNVPVPVPPTTTHITSLSAPENVIADEMFSYSDLTGPRRDIRVSWTDADKPLLRPPGQQFRENRTGFEVEHSFEKGEWVRLRTVQSLSTDVTNVAIGLHEFRVRAISISKQTKWVYASYELGVRGNSKPLPPTVEPYF